MNNEIKDSNSKQQHIRLLLMGSTYALGTFNDNFFKQAASLLMLSFGLKELQGQATILFALPFVLFSAWAGWLADRLPKSSIVLWAKIMELIAMCAGAYGLITLNWGFILAMVGTMGLQSTIFSPALNGSIPETFPAAKVPKINAILKLATTATILLGIALAGFCLDQTWGQNLIPAGIHFGQVLVAGVAIIASIVGVLAALFLSRGFVANPTAKFPIAGPLSSIQDCICLRNDPSLALVLAGEAYFYFVAALSVLFINDLGETELGYSHSSTAILSVALMVGICIGSMLAGRKSPLAWKKGMLPAGAGMGLGLALAGLVTMLPLNIQFPWLLFMFTLTGFAGGMYLIPLTSFIQVRPSSIEKGRVLGISGFICFVGIIFSGLCYNLLILAVPPSTGLVLAGIATIGMGFIWHTLKNLIQGSRFRLASNLDKNLQDITLTQSIFMKKSYLGNSA